MAIWAYRAASVQQTAQAAVNNVSVNKPSGVADGDLVVVGVYAETDTVTITPPGGFTSAKAQTNTGAHKIEVFYKIAASEPASYNFTTGGAGTFMGAISAAYSNGTGSGPWVDQTSGAQADGALEPATTAPSVTTSDVNRLLVYFHGNITGGPPSVAAGAASNFRAGGSGQALCDAGFAAAGATGTSNVTGQGTTDYAAIHVAFISDTAAGSNAATAAALRDRFPKPLMRTRDSGGG